MVNAYRHRISADLLGGAAKYLVEVIVKNEQILSNVVLPRAEMRHSHCIGKLRFTGAKSGLRSLALGDVNTLGNGGNGRFSVCCIYSGRVPQQYAGASIDLLNGDFDAFPVFPEEAMWICSIEDSRVSAGNKKSSDF